MQHTNTQSFDLHTIILFLTIANYLIQHCPFFLHVSLANILALIMDLQLKTITKDQQHEMYM